MIRGSGSSYPALHTLTAFPGGVSSKKNGWTQSPKLPASARISEFVERMNPHYRENSGLDYNLSGPKIRPAESKGYMSSFS